MCFCSLWVQVGKSVSRRTASGLWRTVSQSVGLGGLADCRTVVRGCSRSADCEANCQRTCWVRCALRNSRQRQRGKQSAGGLWRSRSADLAQSARTVRQSGSRQKRRACSFYFSLFGEAERKPPFLRLWRIFFLCFVLFVLRSRSANLGAVGQSAELQARADLSGDFGTVRKCGFGSCLADCKIIFPCSRWRLFSSRTDFCMQSFLATARPFSAELCADKLDRRAVLTV